MEAKTVEACTHSDRRTLRKMTAVVAMAMFFISGMPADAEASLGMYAAPERPTQSMTAPSPLPSAPQGAWMEESGPDDFAPVPGGGKEMRLPLQIFTEDMKTPEVCLEAVKESATNLKFVPEALKTPEMCMIAVKRNGKALEWVPERFRTKEMCDAAVKQSGGALKYVPEALKTPEMCRTAVRSLPCSLEFVPERLKTPELCAEAVAGVYPMFRNDMLKYVPVHMQAEVLRRAGMIAGRQKNGKQATRPGRDR